MNNPLSLLQSLGPTADAVASALRRRGIRGQVHDAELCPLAKLCEANGFHVDVCGGEIFWNRGWHRLPEACRDFVRGYDDFQFPDLIEGEAA